MIRIVCRLVRFKYALIIVVVMEKHHFKILNLILLIAVIIVLLIFMQPNKEGYVIKDQNIKVIKGSQLKDFNNQVSSEIRETTPLNCDEISV